MGAITYTANAINSIRPDFSAIQFYLNFVGPRVLDQRIVALTSIKYGASVSRSVGHKGSPYPMWRTRGPVRFSGSIEWQQEEWRVISAYLADSAPAGFGLSDVSFDITVAYTKLQTGKLIADTLYRVKIDADERSYQQGGNALTVITPLSIGNIGYGTIGGGDLELPFV